ncbi:hypothetical protein RRG08_051701 [Elysia crispata]|uniref:Sialin n=1 Tax=Elysia crispata TaxID=231223 RepID=A0AAE1BBR9_9GAST|nr:hypothetical protein RRG08_051701 [Elysia crispata]
MASCERYASHVNKAADENTPLVSRQRDGSIALPKGWGSRHTMTFLAFLGFINVYSMRVGLSVAMVAMVNSTSSSPSSFHSHTGNSSLVKSLLQHQSGEDAWILSSGDALEPDTNGTCPSPPGWGNSTSDKPGEFHWDEQTQGNILGAFFYGYMVSQIPGGWLATRFGGKKIFGLGVFCTAVLSLLTPLAARTSLYLLVALRVTCGLVQGITYPATHSMFGIWAPQYEKSYLVVLAYAGGDVGTVLSLAVSGVLCDSDMAGGWPSVFYLFGTLGVLWTICWMVFVHDSPASHPRISEVERTYIEGSIGKVTTPGSPPWGKIFSSSAVWGLATAQFASNWGLYVFLTCLPTYMKEILKFDIKTNGYLSAIPYACSWVVKMLAASAADFVRQRGFLSTKNTRKLFQTLGCLLPAGMVLLVGYVGCDHAAAVATLTLYMGFRGLVNGGFTVNHLDIAPKFSGILMAISNTFATIPGFVSPLLVGALTKQNQTRDQWQIVFYITASIFVVGASIFLLFGQGEVQPWGALDCAPVVVPESPSVNDVSDDPETDEQDKRLRDN